MLIPRQNIVTCTIIFPHPILSRLLSLRLPINCIFVCISLLILNLFLLFLTIIKSWGLFDAVFRWYHLLIVGVNHFLYASLSLRSSIDSILRAIHSLISWSIVTILDIFYWGRTYNWFVFIIFCLLFCLLIFGRIFVNILVFFLNHLQLCLLVDWIPTAYVAHLPVIFQFLYLHFVLAIFTILVLRGSAFHFIGVVQVSDVIIPAICILIFFLGLHSP